MTTIYVAQPEVELKVRSRQLQVFQQQRFCFAVPLNRVNQVIILGTQPWAQKAVNVALSLQIPVLYFEPDGHCIAYVQPLAESARYASTQWARSQGSSRQYNGSVVQLDSGAIVRQQAKRQWQASFQHDPIPLAHLPKPIVLKTRQILKALEQGAPLGALRGKRFQFDRTLVRIPVTYRYRLLCRWQQDKILPLMVSSHEAYNAIAHHKKRVRRA